MGLRPPVSSHRPVRRLLASLVVVTAALAALAGAPSALAAACSAGTVTSMHSPDGTTRPFYGDWSHSSTKHSGYVGYELSSSLGSDLWVKLSGFTGGSVSLAANQSASVPARATSQSGKPLVYLYLTASAATTTAQSWTVEVWNGKPGQTGSTQACTTTDGFSKVLDVISANSNKITSISVSTSSPAIGGSFDVTAVGDTGTIGAGDAADQSGGDGVFSMAPAMDDSWPADSFMLTGVSVTIGGTTTADKLRIYPATSAAGAYTAVYRFVVRKAPASATAVYPVQNIASGTQVKYTGSYPSTTTSIAVPTITTTLVKSTQSLTGPPYKVTYKVVVSNTSASPTVLDYLRDTPTASSWSFDTGSAKLNGSALADPVNDAGTLVFAGPFTVPAASGSTAGTMTFLYSLTVAGTVSNSVVGQVGDVVLGGSNAGDNQVTINPALPNVTTSSLPAATVGTAYSQTLAAAGGTAPYTWSVLSGSLPAGLSLNPITGVISGTPTAAGSAAFTIAVTDALTASGSRAFSVTIDPAASGPADTVAPAGSLSIDGGAATTTSASLTLALAASDAVGVTKYRVAEGTDCSGASWVAVASATSFGASVSFTVSAGDGTKTVCVQYGDAAGNVSGSSTATITLDSPPTLVLSTSASNPTNGAFTVTATFSNSVTGFALGDVTVGNGTASGLAGSGTTYTFTVTPSSEGAVTVDVGAGAATDSAGTGNAAAAQLSRSYDSTRPSVALSSAAADPTGGAFSVTAIFSEAVSGLALSAFGVVDGTASNLAGSGTTYTFDVTPASDGIVTVSLGAGAAADAAGNTNTAAASLTRTFDGTRPTAELSSAAAATVRGAFTVTIAFGESVTGLGLGSIAVTNGTASNLAGSGGTYTFDVTPTADGTVSVSAGPGAATDAAGNASIASSVLTRVADLTAPSLALSSAAPNPTNAPFSVTATFSEAVTGFALGDVAVGNGTASNLGGSGTTYTFDVAPAGEGAVTVDVAAGAAVDGAGNSSLAATRISRSYDSARPSVTLASTASSPTNGPFTVTATFSEPVSGLAFGASSVGNGSASNLAGSGTTYTFDVTPAGDGAVTVDLAAGAASDAAGNASTAASRLTRAYDGTPPSVALSSASTSPLDGPFTVTATFSEAVTGFGLGSISVTNGSAANLRGSGSTYTFDVSAALDGAVAVSVDAGAASDAAGNTSTASAALSRTFDGSSPSVALSTPAADPANGPFTVTATFSEPVTGLSLFDLVVGNGSASNLAGFGTTYTFDVTPAGDGAVTVDIPAGAAVDAGGNSSLAATRLTRTSDGTRPTVALTATAIAGGTFTVTATFSEPVTGLTLGEIAVGNGSASNLADSGSTYTFAVAAAADGTVSVDLPAGAASDAAGNGNTAAAQLTRAYDGTRPSVALTATAIAGGTFTVTATFSEPVTGLTLGAIAVGNGSASSLAGSGSTYTFDVAAAADGAVTVDLPAGAASDAAGNGNTAAARLTRTYDGTRPEVSLTTAVTSPTRAAFAVTATFTKPVTGLALGDLVVGNGAASNLAGSGTTYTFDVTPAGDGKVTVDLPAGSAADAAGNANLAAAQLVRDYDATRPAMTLSASDVVKGSFTVTATFGEPVTGFTLDDVAVTNGTATKLEGSGRVYTFDVAARADGHVTVAVPAGAAADAAGNTSSAAAPLTKTWTSSAAVALDEKPAVRTGDTDAQFSFVTDEGATATCSLDGGPAAPCTSPLALHGLAAGDHKLVVRAVDPWGAVATTTYAWTVVAAPAVVFALRPPDESQDGGVFTWLSDAGVAFSCSLDSAPFGACSSPVFFHDLADGTHTFTVRAESGGVSSAATVTWTVRRGGTPPPASVAILPKITAKDMAGRPQPFKTAADTARSKGPFTRKLDVELRIPTPDDVGSDVVYISNYADFRDAKMFPIAPDELYDWDLLAGPSGDRPVYIRFSDDPDAAVGQAAIVLDQELPVLEPTFLGIGWTPPASVARKAAAAAPACGGAARRWLRIGGADRFSGLNAVQVASNVDHPCAWRPFLPEFSYRLPSRVVYVRVADRVGNISDWYRVVTRR